MNEVATEKAFEPKARKVRSDRGKARNAYKQRLSNHNAEETPVMERIKRKYKHHVKIELGRYESALMKIVTENQPTIASMGDGSLPFVIGMLVSKSIELVDGNGKIRNRLIKATLTHLESLKLIKFQATNQFPLGPGRLQLV